jgi:sirohydrochlorin ferrochelatase
MTTRMTGTSVLLIAHGSRRPEANDEAKALAEHLRQERRYLAVGTAFLEIAEPDIVSAGTLLAEAGPQRIVLLPYFLSPGVHVRDDLEEARQELAGRFPNVEFRLAQPLGQHPLIRQILRELATEAEN